MLKIGNKVDYIESDYNKKNILFFLSQFEKIWGIKVRKVEILALFCTQTQI